MSIWRPESDDELRQLKEWALRERAAYNRRATLIRTSVSAPARWNGKKHARMERRLMKVVNLERHVEQVIKSLTPK